MEWNLIAGLIIAVVAVALIWIFMSKSTMGISQFLEGMRDGMMDWICNVKIFAGLITVC